MFFKSSTFPLSFQSFVSTIVATFINTKIMRIFATWNHWRSFMFYSFISIYIWIFFFLITIVKFLIVSNHHQRSFIFQSFRQLSIDIFDEIKIKKILIDFQIIVVLSLRHLFLIVSFELFNKIKTFYIVLNHRRSFIFHSFYRL